MNAHDRHGVLFAALPLKPLGGDGSPVRAFAMEDVCLPS
jgi:kynurenine formamidase